MMKNNWILKYQFKDATYATTWLAIQIGSSRFSWWKIEMIGKYIYGDNGEKNATDVTKAVDISKTSANERRYEI